MCHLIFAPHPDDEILGCGGTIAQYVERGDPVYVCIVTCGQPPIYDDSIMRDNGWPHSLYPEIKASHDLLGISETFYLQLPAAMLEQTPRYILNSMVEDVIEKVKPDTIYIPHFGDMQRDHGLVAEAVMVAVRPKNGRIIRSVYAYETLSETEWNVPHGANAFIPNVYVDISGCLKKKLTAMECYASQLSDFPNPRSLKAVEALSMLRGSTMGAKAAEAFMLVREYHKLGED